MTQPCRSSQHLLAVLIQAHQQAGGAGVADVQRVVVLVVLVLWLWLLLLLCSLLQQFGMALLKRSYQSIRHQRQLLVRAAQDLCQAAAGCQGNICCVLAVTADDRRNSTLSVDQRVLRALLHITAGW